jgi:hypothetical protein
MSKNKTLSIHIGLSDKQRTAVIEILNLTLADTVWTCPQMTYTFLG